MVEDRGRARMLPITIVTPNYNQARFLESAIRSVLDQRYPALEYIVIDGGSTDGSVDIIRRYADRISSWVSEPDGGQTDALIKGFAGAHGEIFGWLNSDDLLEPGALNEVASFFAANPETQAVYGDAILIDANAVPIKAKRELAFDPFIFLYTYNYISQPSMFWRRGLYETVGGLDASFDLSMDADLWIRFSRVTEIHHIRRIWSRERIHPDQKTVRLRVASLAEDAAIRQRYSGDESRPVYLSKRFMARSLRIGRKLAERCYR
jgi:glycosyltransferase involved in cell wall biosynthesis